MATIYSSSLSVSKRISIHQDNKTYFMPAYINDCINCFWNNMKPKSNGDTDNNVAAEIIDQLTPDSGAPNIASPTVSGRVFTEFVIISGHKKLFQW